MNADDPHSDSAESMREYMDEKLTIEGGIDPAREQEIGALLQNLPGMGNVTVIGDEISITYEPTEITSKEIQERMRRAGFIPKKTAVAPSAPPVPH
jgi:hypothetical protein